MGGWCCSILAIGALCVTKKSFGRAVCKSGAPSPLHHSSTNMSYLESFSKVPLAGIKSAHIEAGALSDEEKALAAQFETLAPRLASEPAAVAALNEALKTRTFVAGQVATDADFVVFAHALPLAKEWRAVEDLSKHRHIIRWIDLVQEVLVEVPSAEKLVVDYEAQVPREVKEKEKKKPAEEKSAPAPKAKAVKGDAKSGAKGDAKGAATSGDAPSEEAKKASAEAAKAKKAAKAKAKAEAAAKLAATAVPPNPSMIDFRGGFIQKCVKHPDADSLYMSTIDMGDEEGPRTVCSGLVKYVPLEDMQQRFVVTIANLKPVSMRGVKSTAMVLCASNADTVEFVNPPAGSKAGDKIFFEGFNGTPEKQLNPKKKVWETLQPHFSTNDRFEVTYTEEGKEPKRLVNERGELCKNSTLVKAEVK